MRRRLSVILAILVVPAALAGLTLPTAAGPAAPPADAALRAAMRAASRGGGELPNTGTPARHFASELRITPEMAAGTAACPTSGVYGYAKSQATNSSNQTYVWEFGVLFNGQCTGLDDYQAAYWSRHSCSGNVSSPWCNFASRQAALARKPCSPTEACGVTFPWGSKDFVSTCGCTSVVFDGGWHDIHGYSAKSTADDHYVHFLNPDHYSLRPRDGCSKWYEPINNTEAVGNGCPAVP